MVLWLMEEPQDPKTLCKLHEAFGGIAKVLPERIPQGIRLQHLVSHLSSLLEMHL